MFLFKFFGLLDMFVAVLLFLTLPGFAPVRLLLGGGLYLITKGIIFKGDVLSLIDLLIGIYVVVAVLLPISFFSVLGGVYLFLKGFYSIVA